MPVSDDATYQSAWNEAMRRVVVRDTALLGYVGAAGTLIAASLQKQGGRAELALAVPFVTFVVGCVIAHHDFLIGRLNRYLRRFQPAGENKLWHSAHLGGPIVAGLLLYTLPAVVIFAGYSLVAIHIAQQLVTAPFPTLRIWAQLAAWTGVGALAFGRLSQLLVLKDGGLFGRPGKPPQDPVKDEQPIEGSQERS